MREFRKIVDLPAARLYRADIEELAKIITDGLPEKRENSVLEPFRFSLNDEVSSYRANSVDELLSLDLPDAAEGLSIEATGWTDNREIDRGIDINLNRNFANVQIHALDEVWFNGKIQQVNDFFRNHRPWYGPFHKYTPVIFGILQGTAFLALFVFVAAEKYLLAVFSIIFGIGLFIVSLAALNGSIFPLIDIRLTAKRRVIDREIITIIIGAIAALGAVAGVVVQLIQMAGS